MQSATERDEYVNIVWDKIQDGTEGNFDAYGTDFITNYDVEYDYGSVMVRHFDKLTDISINSSLDLALRQNSFLCWRQWHDYSVEGFERRNDGTTSATLSKRHWSSEPNVLQWSNNNSPTTTATSFPSRVDFLDQNFA